MNVKKEKEIIKVRTYYNNHHVIFHYSFLLLLLLFYLNHQLREKFRKITCCRQREKRIFFSLVYTGVYIYVRMYVRFARQLKRVSRPLPPECIHILRNSFWNIALNFFFFFSFFVLFSFFLISFSMRRYMYASMTFTTE